MPRKNTEEQSWYAKAAEAMVRHGLPFRVAAAEQGQALTAVEAERLYRSKLFQKILWTERHNYSQEIAKDPNATKDSAAGMMLLAISQMLEHGQWRDAVAGIEKLAKLRGWVGSDTNVNVFAGLSAKDYEQVKKRIEGLPQQPSELTN